MNPERIVLNPTAPDGTKIFDAYPGCSLKVKFRGRWTSDKDVGKPAYVGPKGNPAKDPKINGHKAYMVMLRLVFRHPNSGKVVTRTRWFPYTGTKMEFGPYQNYRVVLRARMNEVSGSFWNNGNNPTKPMTATVNVDHF